ncbi:MAG: glutathione S-transferase family protein [Gammaproteobacteria bacterium]|jgi:glutathione S-transferase|nr:glutathione S-transferase family protein [Gammaproteobacteria bacterium]MBT7369305.1 glutathione S-transferase family protein [Gammaproteobacteria bacterium]
MIKLYGVKPSNYYGLVKAILLEKGLEFEEVPQMPSQEEDYLIKSPMGKMPAIEVDGTFLSESMAIALWANRVQPEPPLLPADPMEAAKVLELSCHIKLDVELVARRCLPEAFFSQPVSDEVKQSTEADLEKGMKAVARLFKGDPYAAGSDFTLADLYTFYTFSLSSGIIQTVFGKDLLDGYPQIAEVMARLAERPSIAQVEAEKAT